MVSDNDLANFETGELDPMSNDGGGELANAGGFAGEIAGETGGGKKIDTSLVVFAAVFVAGAAGIWSMRAFGLALGDVIGGPSKAEAAVLDYIKRTGDGDATAAPDFDFGMDDQKWVPVNNLQKNPFVIDDVDIVAPAPVKELKPTTKEPDVDEIKRLAREELIRAGKELVLSSIIDGPNPVAFLAGGARTVDDAFEMDGIEWEIESIEDDSVTVTTFCMVNRSTIRVTRSTNENIDDAG